MVPEEVGKRAAYALLEEISAGGVMDTSHQVGLCNISLCSYPQESTTQPEQAPFPNTTPRRAVLCKPDWRLLL